MNDLKSLDQLSAVAGEMLGGLHADERMRLSINRAAHEHQSPGRRTMTRLVPAVCCAALALMCVGVTATRISRPAHAPGIAAATPAPVEIETIAAGEDSAAYGARTMLAGLGENAVVRSAPAGAASLFAAGQGDIPLVSIGGAVYQMLTTPEHAGSELLSNQVGSVQHYDEQPSLASADAMYAGLSNIAGEGTAIYAVRGLAQSTAVAAEVNGSMRVFQRVSYAGRGPSGSSLEETFSVRGRVRRDRKSVV